MNTLRGLGYIQSTGDAVETFEEKLREDGDPPQWHVDTINAYSHAKHLLFSGDYINGGLYLESLLQDDPENISYLEMKVQVEIKSGNLQRAKQTLEQLPTHTFGTLSQNTKKRMLGQINLNLGHTDEAFKLLSQAEEDEESAIGQLSLAHIHKIKSQIEPQIKHLKKALKLDPLSAKTSNELAVLLAKQGTFDQAEELFNQVIKSHPYFHLSYYNYGVMLYSMVDYDSSIRLFNRAIELEPLHLDSHYALIEALIITNNINAAKKALDQLALITTESSQYQRAKTLLENNQ